MESPTAAGGGALGSRSARWSENPTREPAKTQTPDPISIFCPWADDEEKALRRRIGWVQTAASARAQRSTSGNARTAWWLAAQAAHQWMALRASKDDLEIVIRACSQLMMAANNFESLEAGDA